MDKNTIYIEVKKGRDESVRDFVLRCKQKAKQTGVPVSMKVGGGSDGR